MSISRPRPRPSGSKPLSALFAVLTLAAMTLTMIINWRFGNTLALDWGDKMLQGSASVVVDAFAVALAFAVGRLFVTRRWVMAFVFVVPLLAYVGYSMQSAIGFGAVARIAKDRQVSAQALAERQATQEANATSLQMRTETLEWMRSTAFTRAQRKDQQSILEAIRTEASKPIEVKVSRAEGVVGDPQADVLASLLSHWNVLPSGIQITQVVWLAVLLVGGKAIGSFLSGFFWGARIRASVVDASMLEAAAPKEAPTIHPTTPGRSFRSTADAISDADAAMVAEVRSDVAREKNWWTQVERFRAEAIFADAHGEPKTSTDIYHHYLKWASHVGVPMLQLMSHNRFGRISTAMHVQEDNGDSRKPWYIGIGLSSIAADENEAVSQLKAA